MRTLFFLIIIMIAFSCQNNKKENIAIEKNNEIEKIVECVILQDSLNVFKNDPTAIPISKELKKLKVYPQDLNAKNIPPKPVNGIYLNDLFYYKFDVPFFSEKDSLKILAQNDILKTYIINSPITKRILLTTYEEQKKKSKNNLDASFLFLTIPIFSADHNKAYLEINEKCFGNCGWGKAIYLEKENGEWKIIYKCELWVG
jgi:hypothetical protein